MNTRLIGIVAVGLILLGVPLAAAQPDPAPRAVVYRVGVGSDYAYGCRPPCLCPIFLVGEMRGTFELAPLRREGTRVAYAVSEINLLVRGVGEPTRITGRGQLRVDESGTGGQRLTLELSINGGPPSRFDSGFVSGRRLPRIALSLSDTDGCFGNFLTLRAAPVRAEELTPYRLGPDSEYLHGCYDPCDCILTTTVLAGNFHAVDLGEFGGAHGWGIVRARFNHALPDAANEARPRAAGFGVYTRELFTDQHRLVMDIAQSGGTSARFDSGERIYSGPLLNPPERIDLDIADNAFECFNRVYGVDARPSR